MQHQAEQNIARSDVGTVTQPIRDLMDCLVHGEAPRTEGELGRAVDLQAPRETQEDADPAITLGLRELASGETCSIMDLKGCLAGRRPPPSREEIAQAVAEAEARDMVDADPTVTLGLPPLAPGQTCSIMDLKGCLAGRHSGPPLTDDDIDEAIDAEICARYLRSFA